MLHKRYLIMPRVMQGRACRTVQIKSPFFPKKHYYDCE